MLCLSVCSGADTVLSVQSNMEKLALQLRASHLLLYCFPIDTLKEVQSCGLVSPGIEAALQWTVSQRPLIKMIGAVFLVFVFESYLSFSLIPKVAFSTVYVKPVLIVPWRCMLLVYRQVGLCVLGICISSFKNTQRIWKYSANFPFYLCYLVPMKAACVTVLNNWLLIY